MWDKIPEFNDRLIYEQGNSVAEMFNTGVAYNLIMARSFEDIIDNFYFGWLHSSSVDDKLIIGDLNVAAKFH